MHGLRRVRPVPIRSDGSEASSLAEKQKQSFVKKNTGLGAYLEASSCYSPPPDAGECSHEGSSKICALSSTDIHPNKDRRSVARNNKSHATAIASLQEELADLVDEKNVVEVTLSNELVALNRELNRTTEEYERRLKERHEQYERNLEEIRREIIRRQQEYEDSGDNETVITWKSISSGREILESMEGWKSVSSEREWVVDSAQSTIVASLTAARRECDEARAENEDLAAQNQWLCETIDDLTREKAKLEERVEGLEAERANQVNQVTKAAAPEQEPMKMQEECPLAVVALRKKLEASRLKSEDLTREQAKMEESLEALAAERLEQENQAKAAAEEWTKKQEEYESNVAALRKELEASQLKCEDLTREKTKLEESFEALAAKQVERESRDEHESTVAILTEDLDVARKECDKARAENEDLSAQNQHLHETIKELTREKAMERQEKLEVYESIVVTLQEDLKAARSETSIADELVKKQEVYESIVTALDKDLDMARSECDKLGIDKKAFTQSMEEARKELDEQSIHMDSLELDMTAKEIRHTEEADSLKGDLGRTRTTRDSALIQCEQVIEALLLEKHYANSRICTLSSRLAFAQKSVLLLRAKSTGRM